jgi:hypothetical protein
MRTKGGEGQSCAQRTLQRLRADLGQGRPVARGSRAHSARYCRVQLKTVH